MKSLNLVVNQNEISQDGNEYLTSGGYKSIQCNFSFSEEWNNLTKTAIFLYNGVAYNEPLIDDKCFIPYEAIETKGNLLIGVFGTEITGENLEKRNTTDLIGIQIYEGSFIKGIQPEKPSPETWELYLEEVNKLIEEATNKISSFTAEDIKFEDGETFQEKYDNGEFTGSGSTIDENKFMKKEIYDVDNDGIVDNSLKVNNHTVESDVPANAIFTDTTYEIATKTNHGLMSASDKQKLDGQVAELDEHGKVLSSQLPSYVDDVIEATLETFPENGENGKIYVDIETNLSYRWTGTAYTVISPSIALGETSSTAYRGDRGKTAYEHSQETHAPVNAQENVIENIKLDGKELQVENKEINLNLQDNLVCVNSTEPTDDRKKVWLSKTKNIFNSATQIDGVRLNSTNGSLETYEGRTTSDFIKVEPNTDYTFSINGVATDINLYEYKNDGSFIKSSVASTIRTTENTHYIRFYGSTNNLVNVQLEQGTTVTEYEENVTSAIYTKNNNDEYEKFSETVAISSHQPTNQNGLWLQKSKNLFNKNNKLVVNGSPSSSMIFVISATKSSRSVILRCEPNSTYTISKVVTTAFSVASSEEFPINNGTITVINTNHNAESITITTGKNDKYLLIQYMHTGNDTLTENEILNSLQVEQGSTATDYQEYKEKKIYTKNDNGVYEEFLNADEVKPTEDFSSKVTFNETAANISFFKNGNVIEITYQGEAKTHKPNDILFILPTECRPTKDRYFPFVKNADAYGVAIVARDGNCCINQINSTTASGRIYFTITYIL